MQDECNLSCVGFLEECISEWSSCVFRAVFGFLRISLLAPNALCVRGPTPSLQTAPQEPPNSDVASKEEVGKRNKKSRLRMVTPSIVPISETKPLYQSPLLPVQLPLDPSTVLSLNKPTTVV